MNILNLLSTRDLNLIQSEKLYQGENKIISFKIVLPETLGDYRTDKCDIEMRCYIQDDNFVSYSINTSSLTSELKVTADLTEKAQTVPVLFYITHEGNVIGKTNTESVVVCESPEDGEPLTPREQFDEVIREQRQTITEQAETITSQSETITQQGETITHKNEQITELSGEVSELTTENTRLENLTETQRETIQYLVATPPISLANLQIFITDFTDPNLNIISGGLDTDTRTINA